MASLERRAATPVGRSSYWANDRTGKWRGLGRAQWSWHEQHGLATAAAEVENRRPWESHTTSRVPVSFQYHLTMDQRDMSPCVKDTPAGLNLSVVAEDSGTWHAATPSRMMGVGRQQSRGWTRTAGSTSGARHVEAAHLRVQAKMIAEIDAFEHRLRQPDADPAMSLFPGMSAQLRSDAGAPPAIFVNSSDEEEVEEEEQEEDAVPTAEKDDQGGGADRRRRATANSGSSISLRRWISRPPSAKSWTAQNVRAQVAHMSRLHMAACRIQAVHRGNHARRQVEGMKAEAHPG